MGYWIKIGGNWKEVETCFKKDSNAWIIIDASSFTQYLNTNLSFFAGEIVGQHTLSIMGQDTISGESCSFVAVYDNTHDVTSAATWTIVSGGNYATSTGNGQLTILPAANNSDVVLKASYGGVSDSKTITLTYKSGSSSHTDVHTDTDESGNTTTTTETITENADGSSTASVVEVVTDESGNTISSTESETNTNSDGSYNSSSTTYDGEGNPTSGESASGDTNGNVNTQTIEYNEEGEPYINGYIIDTSGNPGGGETLPSQGINTGVIALDGRGFTIHLKAKFNTSQNSNKVIISALQPTTGTNYAGFSINLYRTEGIVGYASTNSRITSTSFGSRITGTCNGKNAQLLQYTHTGLTEYTIDLTYTPQTETAQKTLVIYGTPIYSSKSGGSKKSVAASTLTSHSGYIPAALDNATFSIGTYNVDHSHDMSNIEILEFEVHKL